MQNSLKHFFISYNQADRQWAEWIAWQLEGEGYTTILQAWDFLPGTNFVEQMDRAVQSAERTIAVLSPNYLNALYTHSEWQAAFKQDPTGEKGILIPVRVQECKPSGLLGTISYIDLVGQEDQAKAREIDGHPGKSEVAAISNRRGAGLRHRVSGQEPASAGDIQRNVIDAGDHEEGVAES